MPVSVIVTVKATEKRPVDLIERWILLSAQWSDLKASIIHVRYSQRAKSGSGCRFFAEVEKQPRTEAPDCSRRSDFEVCPPEIRQERQDGFCATINGIDEGKVEPKGKLILRNPDAPGIFQPFSLGAKFGSLLSA